MTKYKDLSEIELFFKVERYDPYALEELYLRYSPLLYALTARIVNDYKLAKEILIDIFVSVWENIDLFNYKSSNTYTWLVTLTRNMAVAKIRNKHNHSAQSNLSDDKCENEFIVPDLDYMIEPLNLNSATKKTSLVESAVAGLTEAQKYVLYLSYYDGLTINDISQKLNISVTTIRSKIMTTLHSLRYNMLSSSLIPEKNQEINEMIAAYAVGCMDYENAVYFKNYKNTGEYLPEQQLGELQSIVSLLPLTLNKISISKEVKDTLGYKLLETHKKIMSGSLPDRRLKENFKENDLIKEEQSQTTTDIIQKENNSENESIPQELILTKTNEPKDSKTKVFWLFNFLLLAGLILFSYLLFNETTQLGEKIESMRLQLKKINVETSSASEFISEQMDFIDFFKNQDIIIVPLVSLKRGTNASGRFFLAADNGDGLLELSKMPNLRNNEFYTFWVESNNTYLNLASFSSIPIDKYIKITQIPFDPRKGLKFFISLELNNDSAIPSDKIYLRGNFPDP